MQKRGYDVIVVMPNDEKERHIPLYDKLCSEFNLVSVTASYPVSTCMEGIDIMEALRRYDEIIRFLEREKPDLIHSVQLNIAVELAARKLGIPHLMNIYQTDLEAFNIEWMDVYPHFHSADSELFVERWGEGLGIPSRCVRVAYENTCGKKGEAAKDDFNLIRILMVGVFAEYKNQLEVLKFILICKRKGLDVKLTILGDGVDVLYGKKCQEFVRQNGLEKEVVFQGFVTDVENYFARADLMILASTVESYPGVVVESMANRVPVISTPVGGLREFLQDGNNCIFTKGYCGEDIYEAFGRYLSYKKNGRLPEIVEQAYGCYQKNHSYEVVGEQLARYYEWICGSYDKRKIQIQESDVRCRFEGFAKERRIGEMSPFTQRSIWLLYHIHQINYAVPFKKIVIWGAGFFGEIALEWLEVLGCRDKLAGYVDTYKVGNYLGYSILEDREQMLKSSDMVLLAIGDGKSRLENMEYLERLGKRRNKDYFVMLNEPIRI